jgi:hypothetical protein
MNTTATISSTAMSNRIAAGVTAEYVRDLTRRPASAPGEARRGLVRRRQVVTTGPARDRDDCGRRRAGRVMVL